MIDLEPQLWNPTITDSDDPILVTLDDLLVESMDIQSRF
jgi:hypothetical protein